MKHCALVIGHKKDKPGAANADSNLTEFVFNEQLAKDIKATINQVDITLVYRKSYQTLPNDINVLNADFIISLHCNAFNKKAAGCEMLYYHKSTSGKAIAEILQKNIQAALGNNDRGVKPKGSEDRGGYLLRYTNALCIIAEPFFIDNNDELALAQDNYQALVQAYANSVEQIAEMLERPN